MVDALWYMLNDNRCQDLRTSLTEENIKRVASIFM